MTTDIEDIRRKYWFCGKHEYGYRIGKVRTRYFVEYMFPAYFFGKSYAKHLKIYKSLKMAERYAARFEKQNPAKSLEDVQKDLAEMKRKR
jgi:hypothetical protein